MKVENLCGCGCGTVLPPRRTFINHHNLLKTTPIVERFWKKVRRAPGCWLWTAAKRDGYGVIRAGGHSRPFISAHRLSWMLFHGDIPGGLWVLHSCDNPPCVRPDHLFLGTVKDNVRDAWLKGRLPLPRPLPGELNGCAKLTWNQVKEIRGLYKTKNHTQDALSRMFGVSNQSISDIVRGASWKTA